MLAQRVNSITSYNLKAHQIGGLFFCVNEIPPCFPYLKGSKHAQQGGKRGYFIFSNYK